MQIYASSENFERLGIDPLIWADKNAAYISHIEPPTSGYPYILYTIDIPESNYDDQPSWLKLNSAFIAYKLSAAAIEGYHRIEDTELQEKIAQLVQDQDCATKTGKALIALGCSFEVKSYVTYLGLTLNENELTIEIANNFERNQNCYSFPFFWTLAFNNPGINLEDCIFNFVVLERDKYSSIAFQLQLPDAEKRYYNFTNNPS